MPTIKNIKDLNKILQPYIKKAMELTRDEISEIIQCHVDEYYEEDFFVNNSPPNKPYRYIRTNKFKNSLSKSIYPIKYSNGKFSFQVGFCEDYLNFEYSGGATGFQVLGWASEGAHGGIYGNATQNFFGKQSNVRYGDGNVFFWNDAMLEIEQKYGSLQKMFISKCKEVGLPIK